jgi:hypothetical protein
MERNRNDPRIKTARETRSIVGGPDGKDFRVARSDFAADELESVCAQILRAVQDKKRLLRLGFLRGGALYSRISSIFFGLKRDRGNGLATLSGSSRRSFTVFSAAQNSRPELDSTDAVRDAQTSSPAVFFPIRLSSKTAQNG